MIARIEHRPRCRGREHTIAALLTAVILTLLTRRLPELRGCFGAAERLIYLGSFALLLAIGIQLIG